jgi:hypothetical protein
VPERLLTQLLAHWRDAERRLKEAEPDSPEWLAAQVDVDRSRLAYHEAERALRELIERGEVSPRPVPQEPPQER